MIRHTPMERLGMAIVFVPLCGFLALGSVVNLVGGHLGDGVWLALFAVGAAAWAATRWTRFVAIDGGGITYRNAFLVHRIPWPDVDRIGVRRIFTPRGTSRGWAVDVHRPHGLPVTLRATSRMSTYRRYRDATEQSVREMAAALDERRSAR